MNNLTGNAEIVLDELFDLSPMAHVGMITEDMVYRLGRRLVRVFDEKSDYEQYMSIVALEALLKENTKLTEAMKEAKKEQMTVVQIEDYILVRCKRWWDMMTDCVWEDMHGNKELLFGYIEYFKTVNDNWLKEESICAWIQMSTILSDLEVALDGGHDEDGFEQAHRCLDYLWERYVSVK